MSDSGSEVVGSSTGAAEEDGGWVVVSGCKLRKRERKLGRGVAWGGSGAEVVDGVREDFGTKRDLSRKSWVRGRRLGEDLEDSAAAAGALK